jgi:hypothetical protein
MTNISFHMNEESAKALASDIAAGIESRVISELADNVQEEAVNNLDYSSISEDVVDAMDFEEIGQQVISDLDYDDIVSRISDQMDMYTVAENVLDHLDYSQISDNLNDFMQTKLSDVDFAMQSMRQAIEDLKIDNAMLGKRITVLTQAMENKSKKSWLKFIGGRK